MLFHTRPMSSLRSPQVRSGSPAPGCSTLMTSAPNSPMAVATSGPAASVAASTTRTPWSGPCESDMLDDFRPGQSEGVTEGRSGVAVPEHPAALQLGHHQADHVLVGAGRMGGREGEAVACVGLHPLLHLVGHLGGGADE